MAPEHGPIHAYPQHSASPIDLLTRFEAVHLKDFRHNSFEDAGEDDCQTWRRLNDCAHEKRGKTAGRTCQAHVLDGGADHNQTTHKLCEKHHASKKGIDGSAYLRVERLMKDACTREEASYNKVADDLDTEHHQSAIRVPPDFICGISNRIMKDPVVVASGISYEKASIQEWLDTGKTWCPRTGMPLAHLQLVPNLTLKNLISSWLASHPEPFLLKDTCTHSPVDSSVSCPNFGASFETHHRTTSLLSKPLQNFSVSPNSAMSDGPVIPRSQTTRSYFEDKSGSSHDTDAQLQHDSNLKSPNYKLLAKLVPGRLKKEEPMPNRLFKNHPWRKLDGPVRSSPNCSSKISKLISDMQCERIDMQRHSVTELRILAKDDDDNRTKIANAGALRPLLNLLHSEDDAIQQEATTALLNLSLNPTVRDDAIKEGAIEPLVRVVKEGRSEAAMENAAAALVNMSRDEEHKVRVGEAGAIPPLLELLNGGSSRGRKDAATALYTLAGIEENKRRTVRGGGTRVLVGYMGKGEERSSDGMEEKALAILGKLVSLEEGRVAFVEEGGIKALLQVMQRGSSITKRLGASILYKLCSNSTKHRTLVLQMDPLPLLMDLLESGSFHLKAEIGEVIRVLTKPPKLSHI